MIDRKVGRKRGLNHAPFLKIFLNTLSLHNSLNNGATIIMITVWFTSYFKQIFIHHLFFFQTLQLQSQLVSIYTYTKQHLTYEQNFKDVLMHVQCLRRPVANKYKNWGQRLNHFLLNIVSAWLLIAFHIHTHSIDRMN